MEAIKKSKEKMDDRIRKIEESLRGTPTVCDKSVDKHKELIEFTQVLINELEETKKHLHVSIAGNLKAARRARVALVKTAKLGKKYRELSIDILNKH